VNDGRYGQGPWLGARVPETPVLGGSAKYWLSRLLADGLPICVRDLCVHSQVSTYDWHTGGEYLLRKHAWLLAALRPPPSGLQQRHPQVSQP
jgi:hypothetical protein